MEFPAVSQTRIEFWKVPQFNRVNMWWFTLLFGFFGLHHLLLRSPHTAIIFAFGNILLLGYPWFYDLLQLSHEDYSGLGTEGLNKYGMDHPFGILGMAQGMWLSEDGIAPPPPQDENGEASSPPSPVTFLLYCLTLPIGALSCLIAGDMHNSLARVILLFLIPIGFILPFGFLTIVPSAFLFSTIASMYDIFNLAVRPANTILLGVKRPFPFAPFVMDDDGHSPGLSTFVMNKPKDAESSWMKWLSWIDAFGIFKFIVPTIELIVSTLSMWGVSVKTGVFDNLATIAGQSGKLMSATSELNPAIERGREKTNKLVENAKMGHLAESPAPSAPPFQNNSNSDPTAPNQLGGGSSKDKSTLDYFAFAVIISVLLLSAGRTILNVGKTEVSSAGDLPRKNDVPPPKSRYV